MTTIRSLLRKKSLLFIKKKIIELITFLIILMILIPRQKIKQNFSLIRFFKFLPKYCIFFINSYHTCSEEQILYNLIKKRKTKNVYICGVVFITMLNKLGNNQKKPNYSIQRLSQFIMKKFNIYNYQPKNLMFKGIGRNQRYFKNFLILFFLRSICKKPNFTIKNVMNSVLNNNFFDHIYNKSFPISVPLEFHKWLVFRIIKNKKMFTLIMGHISNSPKKFPSKREGALYSYSLSFVSYFQMKRLLAEEYNYFSGFNKDKVVRNLLLLKHFLNKSLSENFVNSFFRINGFFQALFLEMTLKNLTFRGYPTNEYSEIKNFQKKILPMFIIKCFGLQSCIEKKKKNLIVGEISMIKKNMRETTFRYLSNVNFFVILRFRVLNLLNGLVPKKKTQKKNKFFFYRKENSFYCKYNFYRLNFNLLKKSLANIKLRKNNFGIIIINLRSVYIQQKNGNVSNLATIGANKFSNINYNQLLNSFLLSFKMLRTFNCKAEEGKVQVFFKNFLIINKLKVI